MTEEEVKLAIKSVFDGAGFSQVKSALGGLGGHASAAGSAIAKGLGIATLAAGGVAAAVVGIGAGALKLTEGNAAYERYNTQLGTLLGSAEAAKDRLEELAAFGASTPFELPELVEAEKVLIGFGLQGERAMQLTGQSAEDLRTTVGDVAAGLGIPFNELAVTVGKFSSGATGEAISRMQELGIVTKEQLAEMGIEFDKAGSLVSPVDQALTATVTAMQEKFGGGMDALSNTFEGKMSTLADTWSNIKRTLAAPVFDALKGQLDKVLPLMDRFATTAADEGPRAALEELTGLDLQPFVDAIASIGAKWDEITRAFEHDGIQGALEELVGFDLQPLIDAATDLADAADPALLDALDAVAAFVTGTLGPAVVGLGGFLVENKELVFGAIAAYGAFKTALAISKAIDTARNSLMIMRATWTAYRAGTLAATVATTGFGAALKLALGPIGWITLAVGLLAAAWAGNWGGIREKTMAVVEWIKTIPGQLAAKWTELKAGAAELARDWKAKWQEVKDNAKEQWDGLVADVQAIPGDLKKAGTDAINGFRDGLKAAWGAVERWWGEKVAWFKGLLPKGLKMSSPSRVMYEQGYWIIQGLALGVEAAGGLVAQAMERATSAIDEWAGSQGAIDTAKASVEELAARAHELRAAFLSGSAAESGSLAWLVGEMGSAPDFGAMFAQLDIPVAGVAEFEALLSRLVSEGEYERAQELWAQFFEAINQYAEDAHQQRLGFIEAEGEARQAELEAEKRRVDELLRNQREKEQELGLPEVALKDFSTEKKATQAALAPILEAIGFAGDEALDLFWRSWTKGADRDIKTAEDLLRALDAVGEEWQRIIDERSDAEDATHETAIAYLTQRAQLIDAIIANQTLAEEQLAEAIAERERLLEKARERIKAAQAAAEEYENRVHAGVMANIAAQRKAWTDAHNAKMKQLERELESAESFHNAIVEALERERNAIGEEFKARESAIDQMRADLERLKLNLGVEKAMARLALLRDQLETLRQVADSFEPEKRGRDALDAQRKAATERVRITTDEQRRALEQARDSGKLNADQLRQVELLMLGYKQKATDVAAIMALLTGDLEGQVEEQQKIVDANTAAIKAKTDEIELAETLLSIDKTRAQARIDALEAEIKAENNRWETERGRLQGAIDAEKAAHDARMAYLDEAEDRESARHAQRMSDIASEYALMLASLGMTQDEIQGMIAAAQALADQIAAETKALFDEIVAAAPKPPEVPPTLPDDPGGRGSGGIRPKGALVIDGSATVSEGTIEKVVLGQPKVDVGQVIVRLPSGRELLAELVETLEGDVVLTDKLGRVLNERAAQRTP